MDGALPTDDQVRQLEESGFVVLRGVVDAERLADEFDRAMGDGFPDVRHRNAGSAGNEFRYLPAMSEHTPASLAAVVQLAPVAKRLLGGPVLPGRAKATRYLTGTGWHRDAASTLRSIGILCYLDPLDAATGALQVVPGSHRLTSGAGAPGPDDALVVPTQPGDAIVFDERLLHASTGGGRWRRQWRVDFVPADADADALRAYYAGLHAPGWDGGYDLDRYPSYGAAWRRLDARWASRLAELGAFAAAEAEEAAARRARATAVRS